MVELAGLVANVIASPAHQHAHALPAACAVEADAVVDAESEYMSVVEILSSQV